MDIKVIETTPGQGFELLGKPIKLIRKANQFLESIEIQNLSRQTARAYSYDLLTLVRWLESSKVRFKTMNYKKLLEWIAVQRKRGDKPRSINRRLSTCYLFYSYCYYKEIPTASPPTMSSYRQYKQSTYDELGLFRIRRPSLKRIKVKVAQDLFQTLDTTEVADLLKSATRFRDVAILLLMLLCGLRSCEVLNLKIADLNFIENQIKVRGKGNKQRIVPVNEQVLMAIRKYLKLERPLRTTSDRVFLILQGPQRGLPMTAPGLRSFFRHRRTSLNILRIHPHLLRHTFGTEMAKAGTPLPILQRLMGHTDEKMTLKYIQLSAVDIAEEYQKAIASIQKRYENI